MLRQLELNGPHTNAEVEGEATRPLGHRRCRLHTAVCIGAPTYGSRSETRADWPQIGSHTRHSLRMRATRPHRDWCTRCIGPQSKPMQVQLGVARPWVATPCTPSAPNSSRGSSTSLRASHAQGAIRASALHMGTTQGAAVAASRALSTLHGAAPGHQAPMPRRVQTAAGSWSSQGAGSPGSEEEGETIGPAFAATLKMLEWQRLCEQMADFASTFAGRRQCLALPIPPTIVETQRLLEETK